MLKHLRITNFAILSDVALDFGPGFNVLTGETGAGKSLIVDAVALLRGGRARSDIPRAGADEAVVEAIFEPPEDLRGRVDAALEAAGLPRDGEVVVRRVIVRGGRSRIHVNGGLTTATALAAVGALLIDLAGQHEHQGLVDPAGHGEILDAFGVDGALLARARTVHARLAAVQAAAADAAAVARARAEREDFLRFQVEQIASAKLEPGEETALGEARERLRAAGRLAGAARRAEEALYAGEGAAVDVLAAAARELAPLAAIDRQLGAPLAQIEEARALAEDAAAALRRYAESVREDPERLVEIEDRLHVIGRLARKHGPTTTEIIARGAAFAAELEELERSVERGAALERELLALRAEAEAVAAALTAARREAGRRLEAAADAALGQLAMAGARLEVQIERKELGPSGWDRIELLLGANRGEETRPLARVASGGELARVMLALKLALREADPVATYVLDEVDAGVGGAVGEVVGRQVRKVAASRQVLCVTHLPQIAALADTHFRVEKFERDERTETAVTRLGKPERRDEVARMLGGLKVTPRTRAHAEEMLRQAR
jgi:DNA repair protein RecN (Recombination protein N)